MRSFQPHQEGHCESSRSSPERHRTGALPAETSWSEFKENNTDAHAMGVRMSALSNSARLADQHFAYIVWGVRDGDHGVVGTNFEPSSAKQQHQPLEFWLAQRLSSSLAFVFKVIDHPGGRLVLLEIPAATASPVEFERIAYIRIGSATPRLSDYPDRLQALWAKLQPYVWESGVAAQFLSGDDVLTRIDYVSYFELTDQPLPDNREGIFDRLVADRLVQQDIGGRWNITNLGAILFAKRLSDFEQRIARKAVRFVAYEVPVVRILLRIGRMAHEAMPAGSRDSLITSMPCFLEMSISARHFGQR